MFRKNENHLQGQMFTSVDYLPASALKRLEKSWASTFYKYFFMQIPEHVFAPLYSNNYSRPNTPVNILVSLETLKSGFGWSDEVLYDQFLFNTQVRYALGLRDPDEGYFDLRTLYYFRKAVSEYEVEKEISLISECFKHITDFQIETLKIKTGIQRMDSTLIQSNIRNMSRLQLMIEVLQNLWKTLSPLDRKKIEEDFAPFLKEDSLHYCYKVKHGEAEEHIEAAGKLMKMITEQKEGSYFESIEFKHVKRVFTEHFRVEDGNVVIKRGEELSGKNMQSPYDDEAAYRYKGKEGSKGYVVNITETCDKENSLQLITQASTDANTTNDPTLLVNDVKEIKARMEINELWTDGGYTGDETHEAATAEGIDHRITAIKGQKKEEDKLGLEDFEIETAENGKPISMKCPCGQEGELREGYKVGRYSCGFDVEVCGRCSKQNNCPTKRLKKPLRIIRFSTSEIRVAIQRKRVAAQGKEGNIRASVESTIRSVIHSFGGHLCKLRVRGKIRVRCMIILSALMVNIRRIATFKQNEVRNLEKRRSLSSQILNLIDFLFSILKKILKYIFLSRFGLINLSMYNKCFLQWSH